jgi:hypothetical protein
MEFVSSLGSLSPIFSLGLGGVIAFMLIKRIWIMPVGEFNDFKETTERERVATKIASDARISGLENDLDTARQSIAELTDTMIKQVVPAVTRVSGPLNELVELKRAQQRGRPHA